MTWTAVAAADFMGDGEVTVHNVRDTRIALCRTGGVYYAIDDLCTHDGGPLDQGHLQGQQIECPRHGAKFDVTTGRALTLPAVRPVRTYAVRMSEGTVEVDVP